MTRELTQIVNSDSYLPPVFGGRLPTEIADLRSVIEQAKMAWLSKTESARTRIAYANDLDQFLSFVGFDPTHVEQLTIISPEDVTRWRDHLLAFGGRTLSDGTLVPASNATVTRKITALRSFFSFLQTAGYRGGNPAHANFVNSPKVPDDGLTPAIHPKLLGLLLDEPDAATPVGLRDRAILATFAYMALRVDELHHIRVGNISRDGEHTIIRIRGKGNDLRKGVLPPLAARPVNEWLATAGIADDRQGPLFRPSKSPRGEGHDGFAGKPMTVRSIQKLIKKYCKRVGIDEAVSVHSLRVTAATEADKAGVPLIAIQKWLGHRDPRTTLRYIRGHDDLDRSPAYVLRFG